MSNGGLPLKDVTLLAWTYPWWRRPFTWLTWHLPVVKWFARKLWKINPYGRVVGVMDAAALMMTRKRS